MNDINEVCIKLPIAFARFVVKKAMDDECANLIFEDMGDGTGEVTLDADEVDKVLSCELKGR